MNNMHLDSTDTHVSSSVTRLLVIALIFSVMGYVLIQNLLFEQKYQQAIVAELQNIKIGICQRGIRLPMVDCSEASIIKNNIQPNKESLERQFAKLPSLSSAVDKLQFLNGTEADAVKLLTLLNNLKLSRSRQSAENYRAIPLMTKLLLPVWRKYPDMVAASACLYCGNSFNVLSKLIASNDTDNELLKNLAMGHPRLLKEVSSQNLFASNKLNEIVKLQAALSSAGDGGTAEFIGKFLLNNKDYNSLRVWINKGLNGSRALGNADLNSLPYDLVVTAWQQGVSIGYDQVELSQYLVSSGYRPALRWVLWLQDSNLKYIRSWSYKRQQGKYESILDKHTDFSLRSDKSLSQYYSDNWKHVYWDKTQKRWLSAP